jgi:hypothetical protein
MKKIVILLCILALVGASMTAQVHKNMKGRDTAQTAVNIDTFQAYAIVNESGYALDVAGAPRNPGANIQLWERNNSGAQVFRFIPAPDGTYYILNPYSGSFIDIENGHFTEGANIRSWETNSSIAQRFHIVNAGNGYVYIKTVQNNLYFSPQYSNPSKGHNVILWNNAGVCKWKLIRK